MPTRPRLAPALAALGLALLAALPAPAEAWGHDGHRVIGALADAGLSPATRAEVARLLAHEPEPTLAGVATWADEIRDQPEWRHTARWHFVNLPRRSPCTYEPARDCRNGDCVVGAIDAQRAILADRSKPEAERAAALKFLVHFVGDVHQPFHAGFGDDRGGNLTQIRLDRRGWNLHALWDSAMVAQAGLTPEAYASALRERPAPPVRPLVAGTWAEESCQAIFDDGLYPEGRVVGNDYLARHRPLAERRLRQAADRLVAVLEAALAPTLDRRQTGR